MLKVDYLIFDVDGTLVDSRKDIVKGVNHVLRTLGVEEKPGDEIMSYVGTGVLDLIKGSLGEKNLKLTDTASKMLADYYLKNTTVESILYPHVKEVLEYFNSKKKYVMSNRNPVFAKSTLEKLGIAGYFEDILGAVDEDCRKPSTCIFDKHPDLSKFDKSSAIMIGDMDIDVLTAKAIGIKSCWVTYGLGKERDVLPLQPDFVIDDISGLKKIISL